MNLARQGAFDFQPVVNFSSYNLLSIMTYPVPPRTILRKRFPAVPVVILSALDDPETVRRAIETRLMVDPIAYGKPLRYSLKGHRRIRVGDWRIVYRIEAKTKKVLIVAIKHRKDVYED